jgi:putative ABC transport system substrate-binding protein
MGWFKGFTLSSLLVLLPGIVASAQVTGQIVIVKSSDNSYFDQTIAILANHVDPATRIKQVMAQELSKDWINPHSQNLLVALGQSAVEAINRLDTGASSINAYLTFEQYNSLEIDHQVTVLLDQPMHRYLAFCKLMLGVDSIGVIDGREVKLKPRTAITLDEFELTLNQYQLDQSNKLLPVLRDLLQHNDSLLMLPRQSIYNRDTVKGVLLASYRSRKPVVSYSPAHVRSGAVASIYSSPIDIGRHLAVLINQGLQNESSAGTAFQFARFYSITTNSRVATALGINLPAERDLRSRLDSLGL